MLEVKIEGVLTFDPKAPGVSASFGTDQETVQDFADRWDCKEIACDQYLYDALRTGRIGLPELAVMACDGLRWRKRGFFS